MAVDYKDWIVKAENDWKIVRLVIKNNYDPEDMLCYHCHQTAEKYLKAYLNFKLQPNIPIHDLLKLQDRILQIDPGFSILRKSLTLLNLYGVRSKYPDDYFVPSKSDAEDAVKAAQIVRKFCRQLMKVNIRKSKKKS